MRSLSSQRSAAAFSLLALFACSAREPVTVGDCFDSGINNVNPQPSENKLHVELFNHSSKVVDYIRLDVSGTNEDGIRVLLRELLKPHSSTVSVTPIDPSQDLYYIAVKDEIDCSVREVRFADGEVWHGAPNGSGHSLWSRIFHALKYR
jgi:hypothetical protein